MLEWLKGINADTAVAIVEALIAFGFLILVHELGHFFAAKATGIRVERLSLGFGKKLVGFTRGGTEYQIAAVPYGGYVKLHGDVEDQEKAEQSGEKKPPDPESFLNQPAWKRALVFVSGAAVNFLVAIPLLTLTYLNGISVIQPVIGTQLSSESVLARSGVMAGDRVVSINGTPIDTFQEVREQLLFVQNERPIHLVVERDGTKIPIEITEPGPMVSMTEPPFFITTTIGLVEKDSSARQAGLKRGDRIAAIDAKPVTNWFEVQSVIQSSPGKTLELYVQRQVPEGRAEDLTVSLSVRAKEEWDIGAQPIPSSIIASVQANGPAARAGLEAGDQVTAINGEPVRDFQDMAKIVRPSAGKTLRFTVLRSGQEMALDVVPEPAGAAAGSDARIGVISSSSTPALDPEPDSVAAAAGVQRGDLPVQYGSSKIGSWEDLVEAIERSKGNETSLVVRRGAALETLAIAAKQKQVGEAGIVPRPLERFVRYGLFAAIANGTRETLGFAEKTYLTVVKLVTLQVSAKYLAGPVGIVYMVTYQAREGLSHLFQFVAFITVNLAILNLLPLPILDGGHLVFLAVEKVIGRRLPVSVQAAAQYVGLFLLLALMVLATSNDVMNFVLGR